MIMEAKGRNLVSAAFVTTLLFVIIAAALTPNLGTVAAQSSCPYGNCTSGSSSPFPWVSVFVAIAVILAAIILAMIVIYFRRRNPPPPKAVDGATVGGSGSDTSPPPPTTGTSGTEQSVNAGPTFAEAARYFGISPVGVEGDQAQGTPSWVGTPSYAENPVDVGAELDSILAEIEQISGEIIKRS
jgi:hypothetical protein